MKTRCMGLNWGSLVHPILRQAKVGHTSTAQPNKVEPQHANPDLPAPVHKKPADAGTGSQSNLTAPDQTKCDPKPRLLQTLGPTGGNLDPCRRMTKGQMRPPQFTGQGSKVVAMIWVQ